MKCTRCRHLDVRNSECRALIHKAVCPECGKTTAIASLKCCHCRSQQFNKMPAWPLLSDAGEYTASTHCPLTASERASLQELQGLPVLKQRELFSPEGES
jgi:hypothetical protein